MMPRDYWLALRGYLAIWALVSVLGLAVLGFYFSRQTGINDLRIQLAQQGVSLQQKASQYAHYQEDVAVYQSHHLRWQDQGMVQPAHPGQWIATWNALQQQWHLPHMQYEIQPSVTCAGQQCARFWPGDIPAGLEMTVTPLTLRWSVANESDVLDWLQQLQRSYAGRMLVRDCHWSVADTAGAITAACELYWFDFPNLIPDQPA